ncbi:MAG TPA: flagellar biosynthesis protein FlhB [Steroidobacteraceae bacterium]|nr:flagellar biosynthesis protein FlhB [Steroidobacteraceae bacterium]
MAENGAQERTEQATPKRLEEARRKGQIPRSRDLSTAAVTLVGGGALYMLGGTITGQMAEMMRRGLELSRDEATDATFMTTALANAAADGLWLSAPVLGAITLAAIIAPLALGGWSFAAGAMAPQFSRLNPLEGIKRMFAMRSLVELAKAMAKFGIVAVIAAIVLWNDASILMALGREPLQQAIGHAVQISGKALLVISAGLLVIAGFDVPYQLWQYAKQMRMSREEIREEYKESEGSPEVKGRIRQLQQQLARQRMMQEVPKADVVVTNPTHFAVALKYDDKRMRAPIVVAKGVDVIAAKIREVAGEHAVPIFEAPPLARVLYRNVDIGDEIPATLYVAVAQILTYVFQLKVGQRPPRPDIQVQE